MLQHFSLEWDERHIRAFVDREADQKTIVLDYSTDAEMIHGSNIEKHVLLFADSVSHRSFFNS